LVEWWRKGTLKGTRHKGQGTRYKEEPRFKI